MSLSASDAASGVVATYYTIDAGGQQTYAGSAFSVSGDGTHAITFWSVDAAGNVENAESDAVRIDNARPQRPRMSPPSGTPRTRSPSR